MPIVKNPVLPGFHPDPSICKVGEDYYIATSTFEWAGGVRIHHSTNLTDWELVGDALTRSSQLNMLGNPSSGGIWAPCLSWADNQFWLIYTDVKEWAGRAIGGQGGFKDTPNYLVTAPSIEGPWSEPIYMNSSGFDPSLFHDDDGKKWFVNMVWDHRYNVNCFGGILLQEYDPVQKKLVGPIKNIFKGTIRALTEAPHLYKRNGWYYLMTAEGGTFYEHAVTICRSRNIDGPYEVHPENPLLTSLEEKNVESFRKLNMSGDIKEASKLLLPGLQKAGHASMVPWTEDEWILAHLCGRPLKGTLRCPLGRETGLQKITWKDDWPWLSGKGASFEVQFSDKSDIKETHSSTHSDWLENFENGTIRKEWSTLRKHLNEDFDLKSRPGWLRLYGKESPVSPFHQTLLSRRVQHFRWRAETAMEYEPEDFQQFAGLNVRYDETTQVMLTLSNNEGKKQLNLLGLDKKATDYPLKDSPVDYDSNKVYLAVEMKKHELQFFYSSTGKNWKAIGPVMDSSIYSDDYVDPFGFTGMFVGMACHDLTGRRKIADFEYFRYIPKL